MTPRLWKAEEVEALSDREAAQLREQCERQADTATSVLHRESARELLDLLDARDSKRLSFTDRPDRPPIPRRTPPTITPRPLEDRVADARAALFGPTDPSLAGRIEGAKDFLYGSQDAATERREQARAFLDVGGLSVDEQHEKWDRALALCGGDERAARGRGYRPPEPTP